MAKKVRVAAKATKGKGKRWKKGESSNCNATIKKFRQRVNLLAPISKSTDDFDALKIDQLNLSNRAMSDVDTGSRATGMDIDAESVGSYNSFASMYTNCTNVSFSKLMEEWNPSSLLHREMVAVLATITETIKEKGGKESDTEYFAILVTLLETTEKEETLAAVAYLLSMVIKKIPDTVKKMKFEETSKLIANTIAKHQESGNGYLVVSLLRCLSELLKSQDLLVWKLTSTQQVYEIILTLTLDSKPKIRKAAHRSIVSILKSSSIVWASTKAEHHILSPFTAEFCIEKINKAPADDVTSALYMINLIKDIITILPQAALKQCCNTISRVMQLGHPILINSGLQVFLSLFSSSSPLRTLTPELNLKLLKALEERKPGLIDSQALSLWVTVMKEGYISLYNLDKAKCLRMLSTLFNILITCCQSDSKIVHTTVSTSLQQVIQNIVAPSLTELDPKVLADVVDTFESSLSFKYQNAWGSIFGMIGFFMEHVGRQIPTLVSRFIKILADLREGFNTKFVVQIDMAISKAIKSLGPKAVLKAVPIEMDLMGNNEFTHSWLIPLLRDSIEKTELSFFKTYFLPLAKMVEQKIKALEAEKRFTEQKLYQTLYGQIWSLLPSFCREPTDLKAAFTSNFARFLGKNIQEGIDIRIYCLAALRNLIRTCQAPEDREVLKPFAKNYLPLFFNIYINPEKATSGSKDILPVYETLRAYLQVTDESIIHANLQKVLERLANYDGDKDLRHYVLDLLLLFIPYLKSSSEIDEIFKKVVFDAINDHEDKSRRKKGFRLIQEICKNQHCEEFIKSFKGDVISLLMSLISSSSDQTKYLPLASLDILLSKRIIELNENHVQNILQGIIECVDQNTPKCRKAAFELLLKLPTYLDNNSTYLLEVLSQMAPLTKKDLRSAEVLVYGRALVEFNEESSNEIQGRLLKFLDLFKREQRSIIKAVFQILKIWLKSVNREELLHSVYTIVMSLNTIPENHRKAFRKEIKAILTKLVRKFGHEMIAKMCPDVYSKILRNIRKAEGKKARLQSSVKEDEDSESESKTFKSTQSIDDILQDSSNESEDDDEQTMASSFRTGKSLGSRKSGKSSGSSRSRVETYIEEEGDEGEILDLMAPDVNRKIHSTNPKVVSKPSKKEEFPISEDGKIIVDLRDANTRGTKRKKDDDDEEQEEVASKSGLTTASKGKSSYKPGGKGIHRPLKKRKTGVKGARLGEEFKAKNSRGDVKKASGPDPYAYVPLNGAILNRRKRNKYKGYFNKLVKKNRRDQDRNKNKAKL